jgi:exopolyphosphatase/guanosine-5'-triphosphate,3'-diphosphate pyrophosphatase
MPLAPIAPAKTSSKPASPLGFSHWMERVIHEWQRAGSDLAADPVHDLRVALRRCRSMADGLYAISSEKSFKDMKKAGKRIFSALGELRDLQVMTEWVEKLGPKDDPETKALLDELSKRETEKKTSAGDAMRSFDVRQWRRWSKELPRKSARLKRGSIAFKHLALERWTEAYALHRRAMHNRSQVALHQLRIGIKRFRYIVENFLPLQHEAWGPDLKELQDLLGDVHDLDVLWTTATQINAFANEESRVRWQQIVREAREKRIARYRERMVGPASLWRMWRKELPLGEQIEAAAMARLRLWASFLDPDFAHSQRVAALSAQLYQGLEQNGLNPQSEHDARKILWAAALTHDVGRAKRDRAHHKVSYRWIQEMTPPLGWSVADLHLAGVVARFHRGALPQARHKALRGLATADRKLAVYLAGVLRLAVALDGRCDVPVDRLEVAAKDGCLEMSVAGYAPWTVTAQDVAAARHVLEVVLRRPILIKPMRVARARAGRPRIVAQTQVA